jgi:hypothetical protein
MALLRHPGANTGIGLIHFLGANRRAAREDKPARENMPFVLGMAALDSLAPIVYC